jgi:hypothetical protein
VPQPRKPCPLSPYHRPRRQVIDERRSVCAASNSQPLQQRHTAEN